MRIIILSWLITLILTGCHPFICINKNISSKNIPSMADYWTFPDERKRTKETIIQDWVECGGKEDGWYKTPVLWGESTTTEQIIAASQQKIEEIESCMLDKGYRYVGKCDSEMTKNSVACREGR